MTLSHVIEHVPDPVAMLRGCRRLLRRGGQLVVATPNSESLACARFGRDWLHWDPPRHLVLFERASLAHVAREAGFRIRSLTTTSSSSHFVWQASALLRRDDALPGARIERAGPALVLRGLAFWLGEWLLVRLGRPCGEELVLIAEPVDAGRSDA